MPYATIHALPDHIRYEIESDLARIEDEAHDECLPDSAGRFGYDDNPADDAGDDEYHRNIERVKELGYSQVIQDFYAHQMMNPPE